MSDVAATIANLVERARTAQEAVSGYTQEEIDTVCLAIGWQMYEDANIAKLAEAAVAETGMGNVPDKIRKHKGKVLGVLRDITGAISVGLIESRPVLDLDYVEDSAADVDMNVVRTDDGRYIELQGTAEATPFPREQLDKLLDLADAGIDELQRMQRELLGGLLDDLLMKP